MEAEEEPQHRAKAKPRKAGMSGRSVLVNATPDIQSWRDGIEDGSGGKPFTLTQGDLFGSTKVEVLKEATTTTPCPRRSRISS